MQKLLTLGAALLAVAAQSTSGLSESARLAAIYDAILRARFEQAHSQLTTTCPPAPVEACRALEAVALWWRIQLDPESRALDRELERAAGAATRAADEWTRREPRRAEAWFYLAGSYGPLVQWRVLRGERLAAAREGKKIKEALERSLALDPSLHDAHFGIGLYHYYADVAPRALKVLRWLLLLPGGNREQGLQEMLLARERGVLVRGEADYQMHWLYLWYERQPTRALDLLRGLDARYPSNPLFLERIAEVERDYMHNGAASLAAWQQLLDRATAGRVELASMSVARARIGLGRGLIERGELARAITVLEPVATSTTNVPYSARARAQLAIGHAYERLGDRDRAMAALTDAIAAAPSDDPYDIRSQARTTMTRMRSRRE